MVASLINAKTPAFWLVAHLICADSTINDNEGYSLWDDVVDTVTWNRGQLLATPQTRNEDEDITAEEQNIFTVFVSSYISFIVLSSVSNQFDIV